MPKTILTSKDLDTLRSAGREVVYTGRVYEENGTKRQPVKVIRRGFRPQPAVFQFDAPAAA